MSEIDVAALLATLGIESEKKGPKRVAKCPNPAHPDRNPSWGIIDSPGHSKHGSHFCQACKFSGGPWELAAAVWGLDLDDAGAWLRELGFGTRLPRAEVPRLAIVSSQKRVREKLKIPLGVQFPGSAGRWPLEAAEYLQSRGVTPEQIDKWGIGYATRGRLRGRIVIPVYSATGELLTYSARAYSSLARGPRYEAGRRHEGARPREAIFGEQHWIDRRVVTVCEGAFSGLALERAGAPNIACFLSSDFLEEKARKIKDFETILVCSDPDKAGDKFAAQIEVMARRARVERIRWEMSPDDMPHEALVEKIDAALSFSG